jgi:hypothetical protein
MLEGPALSGAAVTENWDLINTAEAGRARLGFWKG